MGILSQKYGILKRYRLLRTYDGFVVAQFPDTVYPTSTLAIYYLMEAIAYPAIHLFVMIGSWFMIDGVNPVRQVSNIWSQTWIVTMAGLMGFVLLFKQFPGGGGIQCVLPFFGRAYWFVTEYIILVILSVFFNKAIRIFNTRELIALTLVFGCVVCVLPSLLTMFPWYQDESEISNFILLYLITACVKRIESDTVVAFDSTTQAQSDKKKKVAKLFSKRIIWIVVWIICVGTLTGSAIFFHRFAPGREKDYYSYNGIFVMIEALAVFMVFKNIRVKSQIITKAITWIQGSSLVVYLLHMHPLFKGKYTEWGLLQYVNIFSPGIYVAQVCLTVFLVFVFGTVLGRFFVILAKLISKQIVALVERTVRKG